MTGVVEQDASLCEPEDRVPRRVHIIAHTVDEPFDDLDPDPASLGAVRPGREVGRGASQNRRVVCGSTVRWKDPTCKRLEVVEGYCGCP